MNPIDKLKDRVFSKKHGRTGLTDIFDAARSFGALGDILGRDYEVRDANGELMATIHQKAIQTRQLNFVLKELSTLKREDNEREAAKWGSKRGRHR